MKIKRHHHQEIIDRYLAGETIQELAIAYNRTNTAIRYVLQKYKVEILSRKNRKRKRDHQEIIDRYIAGETIQELAIAYNRTNAAIRYVLQKYKIVRSSTIIARHSEQIVMRYLDREPVRDIAADIRCSTNNILGILKRNNVKLSPHNELLLETYYRKNTRQPTIATDSERIATIEVMRKEGMTFRQIGKKLGISGQRVHQILKDEKRRRENVIPRKET